MKFDLPRFHHDEYRILEISGLFSYIDPIYGDSEYGASACIAAYLDFKNGIRPQELKTFFPPSWSQEKVAQVIFQSTQNIIISIDLPNKNQRKIICKSNCNLLIEIIINFQNIIESAYPSQKNFKQFRNSKL